MSVIKKLLLLIVAVTLFFVALIAGSQNSEVVALTFLDWQTWEMPISSWVLASFVLGVVLASLVNLWSNTRLRLQTRKANKSVGRAQQDLDKVRAEQAVVDLSKAELSVSEPSVSEPSVSEPSKPQQAKSEQANLPSP